MPGRQPYSAPGVTLGPGTDKSQQSLQLLQTQRITTIRSHLDEHDEVGVSSIFSYYRACYICHIWIFRATSYPGYPSLYSSCRSFNISFSELSLPANLELHKKNALVTGGCVNLGFHTGLRLLRCGAFVIVTTGYSQDTGDRYQ
jgi:hypothetical protein